MTSKDSENVKIGTFNCKIRYKEKKFISTYIYQEYSNLLNCYDAYVLLDSNLRQSYKIEADTAYYSGDHQRGLGTDYSDGTYKYSVAYGCTSKDKIISQFKNGELVLPEINGYFLEICVYRLKD